MKIIAALPKDRSVLGQLFVINELMPIGPYKFGPVPVDGQSDEAAATAAGNPTRDPTKPFGATPTGNFTASLSHVPDTPADRHSYGQPDATGGIPTIDLIPILGQPPSQAARGWQAGRRGIKIHSGHLNSGALAETHGCLRLFEQDLTALLSVLTAAADSWLCSVIERDPVPSTTT